MRSYSVVFGCIGVILAIDPDDLLFTLWNKDYDTHFQPVTHAQRDFLDEPFGGTILGSYVMTGFIAVIPLGQRQRWA
jgi:hypothetical protein